nr:DUF6266 family protein [Pedobacter panaciterrae]
MGIQLWGAFGGFQKKTGALVGRWLKGQNVITAIPHPSKKPPTEAQLNQRAKFRMLVSFLRPLSQLVKVGFKDAHVEKQSAWNAAYVYNYKRAITETGSVITMNYSKVVYSLGLLSPPFNAYAMTSAEEPGIIEFAWDAYAGNGAPTDMITAMIYSEPLDRFVILTNAAARSALTFNLPVPPDFSGQQVYCYLSFVSANGKSTSNSVYLGRVLVM